ncbi:MAG: hypothetical protein CMJ82_01380 [Planctomycetaceae bacterium]|nr:hypothetical protein [Planctomycetaceae bacterium]
MTFCLRITLACLVCFSCPTDLLAQAPTLGYVFPPAIQRGTTTEVQLGGFDLTPDMQVFVHSSPANLSLTGPLGKHLVPPRPYWEGPRIFSSALPLPREIPARLQLADDHPAGLVFWQMANANGATGTATFLVSEHQEVTEQRFRDMPMPIETLPIGISGRLSKLTEKDLYQLYSDVDQTITLDCWARRLGSDINVALQVYSSDEKQLIDEVDTEGRDLSCSFVAKAGETYTIVIHEADFRGAAHFVYRLGISSNNEAETSEGALQLPETGLASHSFQLQGGKSYRIDARSQALGSDLDLQLELLDSEGKSLAKNDDVNASTTDASLVYKAMEDSTIQAVVTGYSVGGTDHRYEISIKELTPGFTLSTTQAFKADLGGKLTIPVTIAAVAGFKEDVTLSAESLPAGVTMSGDAPVLKGGSGKVNLVLDVSPDAATTAQPIKIFGQSADNPETGIPAQRVPVLAPLSGNLASRDPSSEQTDALMVALTMPAPFELNLIDRNRQRVVSRGTTYPAPFILNRNDGYTGIVRLVMASRQSRHRMGITGPTLEVPAGQREVFYPCFMPEWLTTDRTTRMVVYAYGEVVDPKGNVRHIGKNADARITMIMEGALLKLGHSAEEITISPGDSVEIPLNILRSNKLQTNVTLDLELPDSLKDLIQCESVVLAPNQQQHALLVTTKPDPRLRGTIPVTLRATTLQDGKWLVKSIVDVDIHFPN